MSGKDLRPISERAWQYISASDDMLHRRMEALLISQAFLVAAYVQIIIASDLKERPDLNVLAVVVVAFAVSITSLASRSWNKLVGAGNIMKLKYLVEEDPVYKEYFNAVRGKDGKRRWSMSTHLPTILYLFWGVAAVQLLVRFFFW